MTTTEKWEVVGKKGGKSEKPLGKENKNKQGKISKLQPKVEIEESKTIYGALLEAESQHDSRLLQQLNAPQAKKPSITARAHLPIHIALSNVDVEEIERLYEKQKQLWPLEKEKWLRNIVTLFNNSFAHINYDESKFDKDFPLNCVSINVQRFFIEAINEYSDESLKLILLEFIELIYQAQLKSLTYVGYQVFIQMLLKKKPFIVLKNLDQFEGMLQRCNKLTSRGICILWMISQAGKQNLKDALTIWTSVMLGFMTVKAYSSIVIGFITQTLNNNWTLKSGFGIISKADYFKVLSEVFARIPALPPSLHQQLINIYPKIKILAWGEKNENLHNFFGGYLVRCNQDGSQDKIAEILECLVECLEYDEKSFDKWISEFHRNIPQSKLLLERLDKDGIGNMNKNLLRGVLQSIISRDFPIAANPDLLSCIASSKVLLNRIGNRSYFKLFFYIFFIITILFIIIIASLSNPQLNILLKEKFGLSDEWLNVLSTIQANIQNIYKMMSDKICCIGNNAWLLQIKGMWRELVNNDKLLHFVNWGEKRLDGVGKLMGEGIGLASKWLYIAGNWTAAKILMLAHEIQQLVNTLAIKVQPTLQTLNQQMLEWFPFMLESMGQVMNKCVLMVEACLGGIQSLTLSAATWIQHNISSLSLKDIFS